MRCLLTGHDWVDGRLASTESREDLRTRSGRLPKVVANRQCSREGCEKLDLAASRIEAEYEARRKLKGRLS